MRHMYRSVLKIIIRELLGNSQKELGVLRSICVTASARLRVNHTTVMKFAVQI